MMNWKSVSALGYVPQDKKFWRLFSCCSFNRSSVSTLNEQLYLVSTLMNMPNILEWNSFQLDLGAVKLVSYKLISIVHHLKLPIFKAKCCKSFTNYYYIILIGTLFNCCYPFLLKVIFAMNGIMTAIVSGWVLKFNFLNRILLYFSLEFINFVTFFSTKK